MRKRYKNKMECIKSNKHSVALGKDRREKKRHKNFVPPSIVIENKLYERLSVMNLIFFEQGQLGG